MNERTLIETAPHEFRAHFLYTEDGLAPYFACDQRTEHGEKRPSASFVFQEERWSATLAAQGSGLTHPGSTLPSGTAFPLDEMREFRLTIRSKDDPVGERKANIHIAPRWPTMQANNVGRNPSPPEAVGEAVNLHVQGANIEFDVYRPLIERAAAALGLRAEYFRTYHEYSTVLGAERYVRLHRDVSGSIIAQDGPLTRLGYLLEHDRRGSGKVVQQNDDRRGRNLPGYYHAVTLGSRRIQEAFPSHSLPKRIKHYYAREANALDSADPLAHPKLCALYTREHWDEKLGVATDDLTGLTRELEEALFGVLADAGFPLRPGLGTYVEDPYFGVEASDRSRSIPELDIERVRECQEAIVAEHLADGFAPTAWETLEVLVSDGGKLSPREIAETIGRHPESVRRALRRISRLVERSYGEVALRSHYVSEFLLDAVRAAREHAKGEDSTPEPERTASRSSSAFIAWANTHGIGIRNNGSEKPMEIDMTSVDDVKKRIREGHQLWLDAGKREDRFRTATVKYTKNKGRDSNYLRTEKRPVQITAWQRLPRP